MTKIPSDILAYEDGLSELDRTLCQSLRKLIDIGLPGAEKKVWHGHPVWFIEKNPIVGYSKEKTGVRLMFWSGADFGEEALHIGTGKFKDASIFYNHLEEIDASTLARWFAKSRDIQWDYANIVKRKGKLERLK